MQISCSQCHRTLTFAGDPPSYCGYCGSALTAFADQITAEYDPTAVTGAPAAPAVAPAGAGDVIGGYRLLRPLGTGGMGTVYEAVESRSGRHVALKLISAEFARSADALERFRQEGRLASMVAHPR